MINFNTGIYVGAVLETRRAASCHAIVTLHDVCMLSVAVPACDCEVIARRYICSWFPFDMTVVTLDFVLALSTSSEVQGSSNCLSRLWRL